MKLDERFYTRPVVAAIARALLGKVLSTRIRGRETAGMIVETEAYSWRERGCHAFAGRKTARNAIMFEMGGFAYVYLCYGMHSLFNIVTNVQGRADAILVRAVEPVSGLKLMEARRGAGVPKYQLTSGPGKLTQALGIDRTFNGKSLLDGEVWVSDDGFRPRRGMVEVGRRIGIDYAGKDAALPWRFSLRGNPWVSRPRAWD